MLTAGCGLGLLILMFVILDLSSARVFRRVSGAAAYPLVALGRNSLLMYFGSHALVDDYLAKGGKDSIAATWAEKLDVVQWFDRHDIGFVALYFTGWLLLAILLHALRIYISATGIHHPLKRR